MERLMLPEILYDLPVKHTRFNPVFVLGNARSGTSILTKLMRKYLKINYGTESQFLLRFARNLKKYGDLRHDSNIKSLIKDIGKERCFSRWQRRFGFVLDTNKVYEELFDRSYRGVIETIFKQFANYHHMVRWGDKTPEYLFDLPMLHRLFPEAQYIHIVRDGRDVALSSFLTPFGPKNGVTAAMAWVEQMKLVQAFWESLPEGQYVEIRYEDFLSDPVAVFGKLIAFLEIDDPAGVLLHFIEQNIPQDLKAGNFMKWRTQLSEKEKLAFERVAGDMLSRYGYERVYAHTTPLTPVEKACWMVHHHICKRTMKGYWHDNWYKLRLRLRTIVALVLHSIGVRSTGW
jgi:hypothetical protein